MDKRVFRIFLQWLYTQILPFNKGNDPDTADDLGDEEPIDGIITPTPNVSDMHLPLLLPDGMSTKYWENEECLAKTIKLIRTLLDVCICR